MWFYSATAVFFFIFEVFSGCKMDIHGKIREVLAETVRDDLGQGQQALSETDFLHALQCRGIIDDAMKDLHFVQVSQHLTCTVHVLIFDNEAGSSWL